MPCPSNLIREIETCHFKIVKTILCKYQTAVEAAVHQCHLFILLDQHCFPDGNSVDGLD